MLITDNRATGDDPLKKYGFLCWSSHSIWLSAYLFHPVSVSAHFLSLFFLPVLSAFTSPLLFSSFGVSLSALHVPHSSLSFFLSFPVSPVTCSIFFYSAFNFNYTCYSSAGIFKQPMGARNRVGIELVVPTRQPRWSVGSVRQLYSYSVPCLHRLFYNSSTVCSSFCLCLAVSLSLLRFLLYISVSALCLILISAMSLLLSWHCLKTSFLFHARVRFASASAIQRHPVSENLARQRQETDGMEAFIPLS